MLDYLIRGVDDELAERIKAYAREQGLTLNEAMLRLLRRATGLDDGGEQAPLQQDIAALSGTFSSEETRAFREALSAFEAVDPDALLRPARRPVADDSA